MTGKSIALFGLAGVVREPQPAGVGRQAVQMSVNVGRVDVGREDPGWSRASASHR